MHDERKRKMNKQEAYKQMQDAFVAYTGLKVGDSVRVVVKPRKEELDRWPNSWIGSMDKAVGKELTVTRITPTGIALHDGQLFQYPYTALEAVKDITVSFTKKAIVRKNDHAVDIVNTCKGDEVIVSIPRETVLKIAERIKSQDDAERDKLF